MDEGTVTTAVEVFVRETVVVVVTSVEYLISILNRNNTDIWQLTEYGRGGSIQSQSRRVLNPVSGINHEQ